MSSKRAETTLWVRNSVGIAGPASIAGLIAATCCGAEVSAGLVTGVTTFAIFTSSLAFGRSIDLSRLPGSRQPSNRNEMTRE